MGTGKTIGALEMITIAKEREGKLRALIVCHRTDILEQFSKVAQILSIPIVKIFDKYSDPIPNGNFLLFISHQRGTDENFLDTLSDINFFLYDECHRSSGEKFNDLILEKLYLWRTKYVIGLSATPFTGNPQQKKNIERLFGKNEPLDVCNYWEAKREGYIASLKFHIYQREKRIKPSDIALNIFSKAIEIFNSLSSQKAICHIPSNRKEMEMVKKIFDDNFSISSYLDNEIKIFQEGILFACQKFREGIDIVDLGMTILFAGDSIEPYNILQSAGRAMRLSHPAKIAYCVLSWNGNINELIEQLGREVGLEKEETTKELIELISDPVGEIIDLGALIERWSDTSSKKFERLQQKQEVSNLSLNIKPNLKLIKIMLKILLNYVPNFGRDGLNFLNSKML
jgi:superfamily II DNA or RNA helicase